MSKPYYALIIAAFAFSHTSFFSFDSISDSILERGRRGIACETGAAPRIELGIQALMEPMKLIAEAPTKPDPAYVRGVIDNYNFLNMIEQGSYASQLAIRGMYGLPNSSIFGALPKPTVNTIDWNTLNLGYVASTSPTSLFGNPMLLAPLPSISGAIALQQQVGAPVMGLSLPSKQHPALAADAPKESKLPLAFPVPLSN